MVTFEKIILIPTYCLFNDNKHIDLNLLSRNKNCIKIQMLLFMKSNVPLPKNLIIKILIFDFLFVLVLVM